MLHDGKTDICYCNDAVPANFKVPRAVKNISGVCLRIPLTCYAYLYKLAQEELWSASEKGVSDKLVLRTTACCLLPSLLPPPPLSIYRLHCSAPHSDANQGKWDWKTCMGPSSWTSTTVRAWVCSAVTNTWLGTGQLSSISWWSTLAYSPNVRSTCHGVYNIIII